MDHGSAPSLAPSIKVLLVDDNAFGGEAMVKSLERSGMHVVWVLTGQDAIASQRTFDPNIVLLDLHLPDMDGSALLRFFLKQGSCGIIIVSDLGSELDVTIGLELGADDYVVKPPHIQELRARIRAVHRRVRSRDIVKTEPTGSTIRLGTIAVDWPRRTVRGPTGCRIALTGAEFTALETLFAANGAAVSRDRLCETALHRPWRADDRSVDQLIFNLRQKLSQGDQQHMIHAIRGAGYMLSYTRADDDTVDLNAITEDVVPKD